MARAERLRGVVANRALQLLRLGTELGESHLAEIGLVTTLLDSNAQDRDAIANDSLYMFTGQLVNWAAPDPPEMLGALQVEDGMAFQLNFPPSQVRGSSSSSHHHGGGGDRARQCAGVPGQKYYPT